MKSKTLIGLVEVGGYYYPLHEGIKHAYRVGTFESDRIEDVKQAARFAADSKYYTKYASEKEATSLFGEDTPLYQVLF